MDISKITRPVLLLDEEKCLANIENMVKRAKSNNVLFRPHFKTHQSPLIAMMFREYGVDKIAVSSVTMAAQFAMHGWSDITIAFPANPRETDEINRLARTSKINLLTTDYEHLVSFADKLEHETALFIKIDTGYKRSGIDWNSYPDIERIVNFANERELLRTTGLLTHSGHTYRARGRDEVLAIYNDTRHKMLNTKGIIPGNDLIVSLGDTPSAALTDEFEGVDEIRPGNFIFFDYMQSLIGSCSEEDIAVALAVPVVSVNRRRNEAVIYGGSVHLSKDGVTVDGETRYGKAVSLDGDRWHCSGHLGYVTSLSQEHGVVKLTEEAAGTVRPGSLIAILPVHSCLTADAMRSYLTMKGRVITTAIEK